MSDIIIVAIITAIPPTLTALVALMKIIKAERKIDEVHTVIVKGHQK